MICGFGSDDDRGWDDGDGDGDDDDTHFCVVWQDELLHVDESDLWLLKIGRPRGNVVIKKIDHNKP